MAKEWNLPFVDLSQPGSGCLNLIKKIKYHKIRVPIIWLHPEPLIDLESITGLKSIDFIQRQDWADIRKECDYYCTKLLNDLDLPVLMIGAHSDVKDYGFKNIQIGHPSWQKWLAMQAGISEKDNKFFINTDGIGGNYVDLCWGGEIIHKIIFENPEINPECSLLDSVIDIFLFWKELEKYDLFFEVHPSYNGNVLFATEIKSIVTKFLQEQS